MPYGLRKNSSGSYEVYNKSTGKVHAKGTSLAKAKSQIRAMLAGEHGWKPTRRRRSKGKGKGKGKS